MSSRPGVYAGKGPREKVEIDMNDYFDEECAKKNVHYFTYDVENNLNKLMYLDLNSKQLKFQEIVLDLEFNLPSSHKSVTLPNGDIYLIGGTLANNSKSNIIFRYDPKTQKLVKEEKGMKDARSNFGCCLLRNYIYIMGGIGNHNEYLNTSERFNLKTKQWENVSPLNEPSASFCSTAFNNRFIFKFGGYREDKTQIQRIEKYDIMSNKWHIINPRVASSSSGIPQFLAHSSSA